MRRENLDGFGDDFLDTTPEAWKKTMITWTSLKLKTYSTSKTLNKV